MTFLDIDGSVLEGGGQILRISISLSAILGIPVKISNIRLGRKKPGLAAQHLKGIQLVADMCRGKLQGAEIGSTEISFTPGKIRGGCYLSDTKTAGSVSLLLQVALPCALMADSPITFDFKGGTNAEMAPQIDYMGEVFRPMLQKFKADFYLNLHRRGYYPKGGGHITIEVSPVRKLHSVDLTERGNILDIKGWSFVAGTLPIRLAHQMSDGAKSQLKGLSRNIDIEVYKEDYSIAPNNCNGIILTCTSSSGLVMGNDGLGKPGCNAYEIGAKAGEVLRKTIESGTCVDDNAQDQLIIYMALADGKSSMKTGKITSHTETAIYIAEMITKTKFNIVKRGEHNIIECNGVGYINKNIPA